MATTAPVTAADLPDLVPMMRDYCRFYRTSPSDEALVALSRALLDAPDHEGVQLIARDEDGSPLGFGTVFWSWDTTEAVRSAILHDLFVVPAARGGGVGRALIAACAEEAGRRQHGHLVWHTAPDNSTAQRLYDSTAAERSTWVHYTLAVPAPTPPT
jgi:GNAT superfamily N-acetyltransferase